MKVSEFDVPSRALVAQLTPAQQLARVGMPGGPTPREASAITRAKLGLAVNDLLQGNITKVSGWLDQVAERSPAEALRLMMELIEFVQPRLKAAQVVANLTPSEDGKEKLKGMSLEELQRVLAE